MGIVVVIRYQRASGRLFIDMLLVSFRLGFGMLLLPHDLLNTYSLLSDYQRRYKHEFWSLQKTDNFESPVLKS